MRVNVISSGKRLCKVIKMTYEEDEKSFHFYYFTRTVHSKMNVSLLVLVMFQTFLPL